VLDDTMPTWWYEDAGRQAGPVTAAALQRLLVEARISPAHRVWKNGMAGWERLDAVPELAAVLQTPATAAGAVPPPLSPAPASGPFPAGPTAHPFPGGPNPLPGGPQAAPTWAAGSSTFEEIPVGLTIVLAVVTFGIYGLVKYHQTGRGYEVLAGRASRFGQWFWLFIGLGVAGVVVNGTTGVLGFPLGIASAVFQVLSLVEALHLRTEGMARHAITAPVTTASTHQTLLVVGLVLSPIVVGLVVLLVQAVKWFRDWNLVAAPARARGRG
jgi:hypothetical protein